MTDTILVLNAGSSSIKFSLFAAAGVEPAVVAQGQIEGIDTSPHFIVQDAAGQTAHEQSWAQGTQLGHDGAVAHIGDWLQETYAAQHQLAAVGHRVVHGGVDYAAPVRIDREVVAQLETLVPLAPLHQPHNLAPIRSLLERRPQLPQVACFDTAFHRSNPPLAQMFALPAELTESGVRRYGFHGISYEYIASVLPQFDERAARGKTIVLHLGNGASMCALQAGASVASTMGFTALDGLPMGTRCGAIDPGVLLYLMDAHRMDARALETAALSPVGAAWRVRHLQRHARAPGLERAPCQARDRPLLLSHWARDRLARRCPRRAGCACVHRGHWRKRGRHPRTGVP